MLDEYFGFLDFLVALVDWTKRKEDIWKDPNVFSLEN